MKLENTFNMRQRCLGKLGMTEPPRESVSLSLSKDLRSGCPARSGDVLDNRTLSSIARIGVYMQALDVQQKEN